LDPLSLAINRDVGQILYYAREYDQATEALQRAILMDPQFPSSHFYLGRVYLQKAMYDKAIQEFQSEKEVQGRVSEPQLEVYIGIAYSRMGRKEEARKTLERIAPVQPAIYSMSYEKALLCFSLGENERGFEFLDKESERPGNLIPLLKTDPLAESVSSDPRIKALLRKVNLE
jgi:tetratricopeptide (TPR) repeat protein